MAGTALPPETTITLFDPQLRANAVEKSFQHQSPRVGTLVLLLRLQTLLPPDMLDRMTRKTSQPEWLDPVYQMKGDEKSFLLLKLLLLQLRQAVGTCLNLLPQLLKDRQADGKKLLQPPLRIKLLFLPCQPMRALPLTTNHLCKELLQLKISTFIRNLMAGRMQEAMTNRLERLKL
jgi:hypothetical protein